jgi:branched-chain amino acid transport system substrate-binding protein
MTIKRINRRIFMKSSGIVGVGLAMPTIFTSASRAQDFCNNPTGANVTLGFNCPQTGPYAEEGKDQLKAYQLAVKHLNGEGDGGMLSTFKGSVLKGNGILGKKVAFVTGDTQTKADAARDSATPHDRARWRVMITGGSSSGVAIAVQALCQEMGVIFMAGLTHSNDTTGKDKKRYGFRHFFNAYQSGIALARCWAKAYGKDRVAYHLTADYTWGWTQEESMKAATEALGWKTCPAVRTPVGAGDFQPVHHAGAQFRRRRADPQPLWLRHGELAHPGRAVRPARQAGQRQKLRDRCAAGFRPDGQGRRRSHQGHLRHRELGLAAHRRGLKAFTKSFGAKYGQPPSQAAQTSYVQVLLYADAVRACRHLLPARSHQGARRLRVRRPGQRPDALRGPKTTSASRMCLWCRARSPRANPYDLLQVVKAVGTDVVTYDPKIFGGELGPSVHQVLGS